MAKYGITNVGGGGGIGSDETTVTSKYVLSGKTYLGSDTNDEVGTGSMPNQNSLDSTMGGLSSYYSSTPIKKGTNFQFTTTNKSQERLVAVRPSEGYWDGNTYIGIPAQTRNVTCGTGTMTIVPDSGKVLEKVVVSGISGTAMENGSVTAGTASKTIYPSDGKVFSSVTVYPTPSSPKTVTPTTSAQTIKPSSGELISSVTVNPIQTETKSFTPTTTSQYAYPTSGKYFSYVSVEAIQTETRSVTPSTSTQTITPSSGKYLTSVTVDAIQTQIKATYPTTSSQTIRPDSGKFLSAVTISGISTQNKSATPTTSSQTIYPDSGKYLSYVTVGAIKTQTGTVTASGSTQTYYPDTGYYFSSVIVKPMGTRPKTVPASPFAQRIQPDEGYALSYVDIQAMNHITNNATIYRTSSGSEKVVKADNVYFSTNSDGTRRLCLRYYSSDGYLTKNTMFGYPCATKTVTPSINSQTISPDSGTVLEKVIVNAIPDQRNYSYGGFGKGTDYYAINCLEEGYYRNMGGTNWEPEARINKTTLRNYLGINPEKFLATKEIAEIKGSIPDNTTRTSNGPVPGINSSYSTVPVREGSSAQIADNTDGVRRFCICPKQGYYQGGGGSYVSCTIPELMGVVKIKQMACNAYDMGFGVGEDTNPETQSFTLPADGIVYYNGVSGSRSLNGHTWCEIYKNNSLIDSRNLEGSGNKYYTRTTMINKSFTVKKGDVVKIAADTHGCDFGFSHIDATIMYF